MKLLPYPKYKPSVGVEVRGLKYVSVSARLGTVKLRHSGPIRPQDVGNAVRSSPII